MSVASSLLRPSWMEIDLDAPADNLRAVRRLVGPDRKIFAVLKADGYGFGAREMAQVFADSGADALAFADLGDAVWIRRHGVSLPILVFPNMLPGTAAEIIANRLTPTLTDLDEARVYSAAAAREPLEVFVKVDAGLERLGVPAEQAAQGDHRHLRAARARARRRVHPSARAGRAPIPRTSPGSSAGSRRCSTGWPPRASTCP